MRSFFSLLLLCFVLLGKTHAQKGADWSYKKGGSIITAGYGIGNIYRTLIVQATNYPEGTYKISSTGPFSFTYEYGISERFSAGVLVGFTNIKRVLYYSTYTNTDKFSNLNILARANYHFWRSAKFDPYFGIGAGFYKSKVSSQNDSGITIPSNAVDFPGSFGYSGEIGCKYYIIPHLAAYAEIGFVAGSYGQLGLAASF